jgi:hypothetical protein
VPALWLRVERRSDGRSGGRRVSVSTTGRKVTVVRADAPAPCVQAGGINGGNTSQYFVEAGRQAGRQAGSE